MARVLSFPQTAKKFDPSIGAMKDIEQRFGLTFWEYMGFTGDQQKVREQVERVLHKETLQTATKIIEDK